MGGGALRKAPSQTCAPKRCSARLYGPWRPGMCRGLRLLRDWPPAQQIAVHMYLTSLAAAWRRLRWSGEAPSASLLNPVRLSLGRTRMRKTSPAPMQTHPPGAALAGSTCIGLRPASAQERHRGTSASRVPSACQEIQGAAEMS